MAKPAPRSPAAPQASGYALWAIVVMAVGAVIIGITPCLAGLGIILAARKFGRRKS